MNIQDDLNKLNEIIENDTTNNDNLVNQQKIVKDILNTEKEHLLKKQNDYENSVATELRMIQTQKNSSERYKHYNEMIAIGVFGLTIVLVILIMRKHISFLPDWLITLLLIIIISSATIAIYIRYQDLKKRDPLNYQKLNLDKPNVDSPEEVAQKMKQAEKEGDLLQTVSQLSCSAKSCCGVGTVWDSEKMLCVPASVNETFENISPNEPSEYFKKI